jgi:hypothetical protein
VANRAFFRRSRRGTGSDERGAQRLFAVHPRTHVNISRLTTIALGLFLFGCGTDGGGSYSTSDIVDQTPQGLMEGVAWTMMSAVVIDDGDDLSVSLYPTAVEPCDRFASTDTEIIFSAPRAAGEYPLQFSLSGGPSQTITFVTGPGQNLVATQGLLVIEAISDEQVTLALVADAGESSINGRFTVSLCPDDL